MGQSLTVFLKQIDENIDAIHYPTMAKTTRDSELPKAPNPAHSLLHILNPIPHNDGMHLLQGMVTLKRNDKAELVTNVDMANQMDDFKSATQQLVADQPRPHPLLLLKNGGEGRTGQGDEGAGGPGETKNSKKRVVPCESNDDRCRHDRPCKVARGSDIRPVASSGSPGIGGSKSATWERCQNEKFVRGRIEADPLSAGNFEDKIRSLDKNAHIFNSKSVRHLKCGKTLVMKYPYSVRNFKTHVLQCRGPPKSAKLSGAGMQLITAFFDGTSKSNTTNLKEPCPGLTDKEYPDVAGYLARTGAHGGGAPSVTVIAQELYGKKYRKLSKLHKGHVKTAQRHEWLWRNDHDHGRVFATNCLKVSNVPLVPCRDAKPLLSGKEPSKAVACRHCRSLLTKRRFRNAAHVPQPPDTHYKFLNYEYRNKQLAILYGQCTSLRAIIESTVSELSLPVFVCVTLTNLP
jgi:hypothetical protein